MSYLWACCSAGGTTREGHLPLRAVPACASVRSSSDAVPRPGHAVLEAGRHLRAQLPDLRGSGRVLQGRPGPAMPALRRADPQPPPGRWMCGVVPPRQGLCGNGFASGHGPPGAEALGDAGGAGLQVAGDIGDAVDPPWDGRVAAHAMGGRATCADAQPARGLLDRRQLQGWCTHFGGEGARYRQKKTPLPTGRGVFVDGPDRAAARADWRSCPRRRASPS